MSSSVKNSPSTPSTDLQDRFSHSAAIFFEVINLFAQRITYRPGGSCIGARSELLGHLVDLGILDVQRRYVPHSTFPFHR